MGTVNVYFIFKDEEKIEVTLDKYVYEMWINDKDMKKAISKLGKVELK